jgi:hypothetical protein
MFTPVTDWRISSLFSFLWLPFLIHSFLFPDLFFILHYFVLLVYYEWRELLNWLASDWTVGVRFLAEVLVMFVFIATAILVVGTPVGVARSFIANREAGARSRTIEIEIAQDFVFHPAPSSCSRHLHNLLSVYWYICLYFLSPYL